MGKESGKERHGDLYLCHTSREIKAINKLYDFSSRPGNMSKTAAADSRSF